MTVRGLLDTRSQYVRISIGCSRKGDSHYECVADNVNEIDNEIDNEISEVCFLNLI